MDFARSPADIAFRAEVQGFLRQHLTEDVSRRILRGYHQTREDTLWWTRILAAQGWSVPNWPVEHGGPGWSVIRQHIFEEECFLAGAPQLSWPGVRLVAPVIWTFGSAAQKQAFLPPIRRGEILWGQGFSEPNAGSDLASLRTGARRDGDSYIVNGQKIWTSGGHHADWLFCLVRTDPAAKPQRGISFLLIDRHSPGITVRPIVTIDEGHSLNEMFFDDVLVPVANRVGEEGQGWACAKFLLNNERSFSAEVPRSKRAMARLRAIAETPDSTGRRPIDDADFATRVTAAGIELAALEISVLRCIGEDMAGAQNPFPVASVLKIRGSELQQTIGALMVEALGEDALAFHPDPAELNETMPGPDHAPGVMADFLYRRATTIYGGANEVQRNLIARSLLEG